MIRGDRWQQVKELLDEALDRPPEARRAFLRRACADDELLHRQVESFLEEEERAGDFLVRPIFSLRDDAHRPGEEERRIGPYRLLRRLGSGGMGAVYLAERADGQFEHRVAIKLLKRGMDSDEIVRRFQAERQILARLEHPHVARLLDGGSTGDGRPFFVMEYVAGEPIDEYCDARKLPPRERLKLFRKVCSAVHFAHQNLVVHRDLKPSNILVTAEGAPKLLDFGIAKLLEDDPRRLAAATSPGTGPMTPRYASPEQVRGEPVTTAADVYALGVLLYELLTGRRPYRFDTETPGQIARAICEQTPPRPSTVARRGDRGRLRRRLAGDLDNIVLKAMRKEPERRFASAEQLSEDLRRHLEGLPVAARKDTLPYRAGKFVRRHGWGVATAAGVAALILGFAIHAAVQRQRIAAERDRSQAVKDFLVEFLRAPDPSRARGESLTVREALEAAVGHLDEELGDEPEIRADLLDAVGRVYLNLALYPEARPLLEEALALRRASLGGEHPATAASLLNLAGVESELGRGERAEELTRSALEIQRRAFPRGHPALARGINNLALLLRERGHLQEAEDLAREALAMKKKLFGVEHPDVATALNTLATVLRDQGELDEAEGLFRECLAIRRRRPGADPRKANTLANLAGLLADRGEAEAALGFHQEALAMREKLYRGDHPHLVSSFRGLARLLALMGEHERAAELLEQALAMQLRLSGEGSSRVDALRRDLAALAAARSASPPARPGSP